VQDNGQDRGGGGAASHSAGRGARPAIGPVKSKRLAPVFLSLLVFPGLGQLALGRVGKGLLFALPSAALLVALMRRVWTEASRLVPTEDPDALLDPALPFRLAGEIQRANAPFFTWVTIGIVCLWALSAVDAWRDSSGRSPEGRPAK
jgi:hypothetical protein